MPTREPAGTFEPGPEVGGEMGRFANLALRSQGFLRGRRRVGDEVENDLHVRAARPRTAVAISRATRMQ
jgi:hypothetical protein